MASFSKLSVWPVGYFRAASSWLLRNRRDLASRMAVITAEVERVGHIRVYYKGERKSDGSVHLTEERVGMSVTRNSNVERLLQAYIAQGGNPFDISPFMHPDQVQVSDVVDGVPIVEHRYPRGGVVAPRSAEPNSPEDEADDTGFGSYRGGWLQTDRYYPARQGGRQRMGSYDSESVVKTMQGIRKWAMQDIKERVLEIEARIIKQCDLREQLVRERDEVVVGAFGGTMHGIPFASSDRFNRNLLVQNLIAEMNKLLYQTNPDGSVRSYSPNDKVGLLPFTFEDLPSEHRDPLGG